MNDEQLLEKFENIVNSIPEDVEKEQMLKFKYELQEVKDQILQIFNRTNWKVHLFRDYLRLLCNLVDKMKALHSDTMFILTFLKSLLLEDVYPLTAMSFMPLIWIKSQWTKGLEIYKKYPDSAMCYAGVREGLPNLYRLSSHPELSTDFIFSCQQIRAHGWFYSWKKSVLCRRFLDNSPQAIQLFLNHSKFFLDEELENFSWFTEDFIMKNVDVLVIFGFYREAWEMEWFPAFRTWTDNCHKQSFEFMTKLIQIAITKVPETKYDYNYDIDIWIKSLSGFSSHQLSTHPDLTVDLINTHSLVWWDWKVLMERFPDMSWMTANFIADQFVERGHYTSFIQDLPATAKDYIRNTLDYSTHKKALKLFCQKMVQYMCNGQKGYIPIKVSTEMREKLNDSQYRRNKFKESIKGVKNGYNTLNKELYNTNKFLLKGLREKKKLFANN